MRQRGFTLLEVMVAMAILAGSLTVLIEAQQQSVRASNRSKMTTTAVLLAREKLADLEAELFKDGFSDLGTDSSGDFSDEGFTNFRWEWKVETVELPSAADAQAAGGTASGTTSGAGKTASPPAAPGAPLAAAAAAAGSSDTMDAATAMIASEFEMIRGLLESSVRRATFTIYWKEGGGEQSFTVQSYFTDPARIDAAMGGLPGQGTQPGAQQGAQQGVQQGAQQGTHGTQHHGAHVGR
jgi:general secretion pathway protein I